MEQEEAGGGDDRVAFKHPRREKMLRGQMIELQLSAPDAAARDVLFLGGAPLLF